MRRILIALLIIAAVMPAIAGRTDWKIGVQAYTFNNKSLLDTAVYCASNGIQYIEIYPGQRIGEGFEGNVSHEMREKEADRLKTVLKEKGVSLISYGVVRAGNESEWRPVFDFAKRMGIQTIIAEPNINQMEMLDKLTEEYGVKVGIHNHGEPTPDQVTKLLAGRSNRVCIAPDNGHWSRRGIENIESLKRFEGRIASIHLKELNEAKSDVPYGEGVVPVTGILECLDKMDYKGPIIIEYESGNKEVAVRKCNDYLKAFISRK